jgi:hypothetical protein
MSTRKRQEVKSNFPTPWQPENKGDTLEGVYHGYNEVDDNRGGKFKSHKIKPEGSDVFMGVSGSFLDQKMIKIPKGTYVWITFMGEVKVKNGMAKDFTVECEEGTKLLDDNDNDIPI